MISAHGKAGNHSLQYSKDSSSRIQLIPILTEISTDAIGSSRRPILFLKSRRPPPQSRAQMIQRR
ncbi:hypothetical protein HAV15_012687 [Penicillium sp. str. |nr:hypothetical protein HAV15_012687 [Penicillium sp. str. \